MEVQKYPVKDSFILFDYRIGYVCIHPQNPLFKTSPQTLPGGCTVSFFDKVSLSLSLLLLPDTPGP